MAKKTIEYNTEEVKQFEEFAKSRIEWTDRLIAEAKSILDKMVENKDIRICKQRNFYFKTLESMVWFYWKEMESNAEKLGIKNSNVFYPVDKYFINKICYLIDLRKDYCYEAKRIEREKCREE